LYIAGKRRRCDDDIGQDNGFRRLEVRACGERQNPDYSENSARDHFATFLI
jgi:hypothetical protein